MSWVKLNAYLATIPQSEPDEETEEEDGKKKPGKKKDVAIHIESDIEAEKAALAQLIGDF